MDAVLGTAWKVRGKSTESRAQTKGTRDGKGIVFVSYDGHVYPAGFLPLAVGESPLLREIRAARFHGRCGTCEYADLCGGSRARAYAASGDPLGEDPACLYLPAQAHRLAAVGTPARSTNSLPVSVQEGT